MSTLRANTITDSAGTGSPSFSNGAQVPGAVTSTVDDDGTFSTGTYTPTPVGGNYKKITNAGAFTLAAPTVSGDYTLMILIHNTTGAGTITLSGFTKTSGSAFTTTTTDKFLCMIVKIDTIVYINTAALQ